jgi:hypothetical protein
MQMTRIFAGVIACLIRNLLFEGILCQARNDMQIRVIRVSCILLGQSAFALFIQLLNSHVAKRYPRAMSKERNVSALV